MQSSQNSAPAGHPAAQVHARGYGTQNTSGLQVGIIDTGIALGHEDLRRNVNKKCEDFVNGDHTCDEGKVKGPSKGARGSAIAECSLHVVGALPDLMGCRLHIESLMSGQQQGSLCWPAHHLQA